MFSTPNWGEFAVLGIAAGIVLVKALAIGALAYWAFGKTAIGRGLRRRGDEVAGGTTLQVTDQVRSMQAQLEDLHARVDFTERLLIDQRDQLRMLGIESASEPHMSTPV